MRNQKNDITTEKRKPFQAPLLSDEVIELLNALVGRDETPLRQYYDTAGCTLLTKEMVKHLEDLFFQGCKHKPNSIRLEIDSFGRKLLCIIGAKERAPLIFIASRDWPLVKFYHLTEDGTERSACFRHAIQ